MKVKETTAIDELDPKEYIIIKNARVNNLKSLSVAIPRNKLVVVTGLSGSGKSSLAFDTLFAEDSGCMWRVSTPTLDSFSAGWKNPMWNTSKEYLQP